MKEKMKSKKTVLVIVGIILILALAALLIWFGVGNHGKGTNKDADKQGEEVPKEDDKKIEKTENTNDTVYIVDCDSTDVLEEMKNIQVVTDEGLYVQGKGAYLNASTLAVFCEGKLKESVDISQLKGGSVHISFYIGSKANFVQDICFELSSAGTYDQQELQWSIPLNEVREGWNEKYLPISEASETGNINLTAINYFRFYSPELNTSVSLDVILDDVYATKKAGEDSQGSATADGTIVTDSYKETGTNKGTRIMSCNTVNILSSLKNLEVTTNPGEYVEGSGAMKIVNANYAECHFAEPIDLSAYEGQEGKLHISFYINDASLLTGLTYFYLSSAGNIDEETIYWYLQTYQFQSGWNELNIPFYTSALKRNPDFSAINYFKVHLMGVDEGAVVIIDDIYATND